MKSSTRNACGQWAGCVKGDSSILNVQTWAAAFSIAPALESIFSVYNINYNLTTIIEPQVSQFIQI